MATSDETQDERVIFHAALALAGVEERQVLLRRVCGDDTDLKSRIEGLLAAHAHAEFLNIPAAEREAQFTADESVAEQQGSQIGRYKLLEQIGEGGFGVVYMAEQQEPIQRKVALKVIKLGMDTKQVIARFEAERQALALMDHPNIGKILDAGATQNGRPYFVMELVRGIPITEYCGQRRLSTKERLGLFTKVCGAIEHAHQKGIVHRDIKPTNILVYNQGDRSIPKVIDFGIAKATQGRLTEKTLFTQFHQFIGTPAYMSPEQAQMSGVDVDTRSDIYSLGVLLYEMLTGKTPLDLENLKIQAYEEARRRIREDEALMPSKRVSTLTRNELSSLANSQRITPVEVSAQLREDLDWIVMKALDKDRSRRYQTTDAFSTDIRRHLQDEPVSAGPPSVVYHLRKLLRRHRTTAFTALAIALTLVIAVIISSVGWRGSVVARRNSDSAMKEANKEKRRAIETAYLADMRVAHQALDQDRLGLARRILARYNNFSPDDDPRHWEWRALQLRCQGNAERTFGEQDGSINGLSVHPEGELIVTGGAKLRVWNVNSGLLVYEFPTQGIGRFAPSGDVLYTTDPSGLVRGWRVPGFEATDFIISHGDAFSHRREMQISPDGKILATFGDDSDVVIWDVETKHPLERIPTASQYRKLVFSPDSSSLLVTGKPHNFTVKLSSMEVEDALDESGRSIHGEAAFSPNGEHLACSQGRSFSIQRLSDGEQIMESADYERSINEIAYSTDGRILASSENRTIRLHDWESNREIARLRGHDLDVAQIAFLPDGRLVSGGRDGKICVWNLNDATKHKWPIGIRAAYKWNGWRYWPAISCSRDGATIASTNPQEPGITLRSANDLSEMGQLAESSGMVGAVIYSPVEDLLVFTNESGALEFMSPNQGRPNEFVDDPDGKIVPLQFTPDGERLLAVVKATEPIKHYLPKEIPTIRMLVYRVADRQQLASWTIPQEFSVAISPDGKVVVTGHDDGLRFWSVENPEDSTHVLVGGFRERNTGLIRCVDFSPNGKHVIAGTNGKGHIEIVDAETRQPAGRLEGHIGLVGAVRFSSDGKRVASGGTSSDTVKIWDFATRREIMTLNIPDSWSTRHVEWLPGDNAIMVGTGDSILAIFRATPQETVGEYSK